MKKNILIIKIGILFLYLVLVCSSMSSVMAARLDIAVSSDPAIINQILEVTVTRTDNGNPVEGALVQYILNNGDPINTYTNVSGISTFKPQLTGELVINASSDTVLTGTRAIKVVEEAAPLCFIATAAYGTPLHEDIDVLRDFRDEYLMTNPLGRGFVKVYYETSPPIAEVISEHEGLRMIVREGMVKPLVYIVRGLL